MVGYKIGDKVEFLGHGGYIWTRTNCRPDEVYGIIQAIYDSDVYVLLFTKNTNRPISLSKNIRETWRFPISLIKEYKMDKVIERLDAIEREAKELRAIIEKAEEKKKIIYNEKKLYVCRNTHGTYGVLVGYSLFRFQSFHHSNPTICGWGDHSFDTAQKAIAYVISEGCEVFEFSDVKEGLEFFLKNYKG